MPLNLTSLRLQLREGLGLEGDDTTTLPNTDTADKTGADTYLNRAYWELLDKFPFREKEVTSTLNTVAGTKSYAVPVPFEAVQSIAIEDPDSFQHTPLDRMEKDEYEQKFVDNVDSRSKPTRYYRQDDQIILYPTPDKVYKIPVHRWTVLSDLSSSNPTPDAPRGWHEIVLFGGLWRAFIGVNGDYVRARAAKANQISLIEGLKPVEQKEKLDSHRAGIEVIGLNYDQL